MAFAKAENQERGASVCGGSRCLRVCGVNTVEEQEGREIGRQEDLHLKLIPKATSTQGTTARVKDGEVWFADRT